MNDHSLTSPAITYLNIDEDFGRSSRLGSVVLQRANNQDILTFHLVVEPFSSFDHAGFRVDFEKIHRPLFDDVSYPFRGVGIVSLKRSIKVLFAIWKLTFKNILPRGI